MFAKARRTLLTAITITSVALTSASYAQSGGATLQGTVTDPNGAVVPNARIGIVSQLTGVSRDVTSNNEGIYSAPNLSAGRYKVTTSASGFATNVQTDVLLTVGAVRDFDIPLTLATTDITITVESSSNQVNSVDTSVQGIVDGKQTRDLPLNGRDWTTLATLNSGVSQILTQFPGAATATTRLSRGLGAQLTIGGNRPQQNSYRLDGVNINDYANGGPGSVSGATLGVDAVQEFNVITSDAPAQYGRMSGGVINSITRQGSNQLHGSAYDFIRNSVFDARSYFDPVGGGEPSFRRNQFGGTLGGPIIRDKTFFFFNYEGFRQAQGVSMQSTVLSPNARTGLVTCTSGSTCKNGLQQLKISPAVSPFLTLFPLPNSTVSGNTGIYSFLTTQKANEDFSTVHGDHNFSQSDSIHGTLLYDTASLDSADQTNTLYDEAISRRTTAAIEEVHLFSPRLTNSFRLGYNRSVAIAPTEKAVINPAVNNPALAYYAGYTTGQLLVSSLTTVQGGSGAVGTNSYHYNSYQLYDDATYVRGKHSITFGGVIEYIQNNTNGGVLPNGEWNFGSINNFLTNVPTFFEGRVPGTPVVPHDLRQTLYSAYVQDSWKMRNYLTINLGLRYEMVTDTTETRGRIGALPTQTSPAAVPIHTFFTNNPTTKNFEPRIGVAWDPFRNGKTIVSVASGIYDILPLNYTLQLQLLSSAPSYQEGRVTYSGTTGKGLFPVTPFVTTTPQLRVIYTPQNPPRSYVIQNNVNLQQQLTPNTVFQIGYIGSHGVHQLFSTNDINNVPSLGKDPSGNYYWPDLSKVTGAARSALQLNPAVGTESDTIYAGSSIYHSLQTSISYAAPKGVIGKIAYTWSHSIDDSSSQVSGASFGNSVSGLPAFDLSLDRADSDFDIRHVFSANAIAPLPNIKRGGGYTSILRGWSTNNIFTIRSGIPFTPVVGGDPLGLLGSQTFQFPDRIVHGRSCTNSHNVHYIDTSCFAFPGTYAYGPGLAGPRLGTGRRNTLDGPGLFNWTTGLMKDQVITERLRAQFQAQAFNVTNHTNFANPASAQTQIFNVNGSLSGTAGTLTSVATQGRQLQFALKLLF
ncbi:TonB-dependent receptor [Edaphobacter bradus]|uniref:TonB-dependent receptor n=1 Tax=Edaphobacter bradus TaxID=2259016 RepID=UPI0021DF60E6|nr:carboxypeptidase regulatory-like domain-containing protein [Edaphobacter bradus]